ncbi:hypothetical protein NPA31_005230 [Aurantimonas sp. MSK8Z-1]|nr:hypothetical protein [Aurantimonas sp. MSK8Z-1]MCW4114364.1 hypothetical protein [Aurantimonas sp. MSK8Z-1]
MILLEMKAVDPRRCVFRRYAVTFPSAEAAVARRRFLEYRRPRPTR